MEIDSNKLKGIVVSSKANYFNVDVQLPLGKKNLQSKSDINCIRLLCTCRSKLKHLGVTVYVGDNVLVESIDWNSFRGVIYNIEERQTWINRPPVANVTNVFVLLSVTQPEFNFEQASKFLITAEKTGVDIDLVLTKTDLIPVERLKYFIDKLNNWCYKPIPISNISGEGIGLLVKKLKLSRLSVFCGPSGVGKTSLINFLLPEKSLNIAPVSIKLKRGRHTTRNVELFSLDNGSLVADTPGFNRPDLEIIPKELPYLFPELRSQVKKNICKFRDCTHRDEPGCSINKNWQRYSFYRDCLEEMISLGHQFQED